MFPRLLPIILSLVAPLVLLFSALSGGARADEATLNQTFIQSQINDLESSAKHDLEDAARAAARASEYGDKERAAQKTSDGATNATVKEVWSETASDYRKSRIHEEEEQTRLKDSAAQKQAEAQRLRGQLTGGRDAAGSPPPPPAPPPPSIPTKVTQSSSKRHADLVDFIGLWRDRAYAGDVILEAEDPENPTHADRVKLTGKKNLLWEGHVALGETGRPTRFTFTVRPTWDQLNPEIPEWARKQVEGVVEWKLELEHDEAECVCVDATLHAKWYPGEVRWAGDGPAGTARVTGPGKPIEFELNKEDDDIELAGYFSPTIVVHLGDPERARVEPIEYLIHGQEFQVQILMTREEAKKRGDVIEIKVQGKTGGSQTTVKLTLAAQTRNNLVVRYEQHGQLTFDDKGKEYSQGTGVWEFLQNHRLTLDRFVEWWYGGSGQPPPEYGTEGGRLPLKLKNGEEVEFTFEKAAQSVRVYDTQAKLILARYTDTFENLIQTLGTLLTNPKLSEAQRNNAQVRLRIVQNALAFATKVTPEQLNELVRMEVVRIYYQEVIFDNRPQTLFRAGGTEAPPTNPYGIVWVSQEEKNAMEGKIRIYRDKAQTDVLQMGLDTALGKLMPMVALATAVPSMIFHVTPFGDAYIVVEGRDVMGNKVDLSDRIGAACNLTLSAITFGINTVGLVREISAVQRIHQVGEAAEFSHRMAEVSSLGHAGAGIERDANIQALIKRAVEAEDLAHDTTCARSSPAAKAVDLKTYYSAEIKTKPAPEYLRAHKNTGPNCRFEGIDDAVAVKTGASIDPDLARKLRDKIKVDGKPMVPFLQAEGGSNSQVRAWANWRGAQVTTVWATVPDIAKAHAAGLGVTAEVLLNGTIPALHQVTVTEVEYGPIGRLFNRPKYFWLHDSNFPDILIGMSASEFDRLLLKPDMLVRVAAGKMLESGKKVFVYVENAQGEKVLQTKLVKSGKSHASFANDEHDLDKVIRNPTGNVDLIYIPKPPTQP